MSQRIRYVTDTDNFVMSTKPIETVHGELYVRFNPESKVVMFVKPLNNDLIVVESYVETGSLHSLKINIKNKLMSMGATFKQETRERTKKEEV